MGLFAAFYAGMRGMSVRLIDSLPQLGGQLMALYPEKYIYDMPGFPQVLAKDLANRMIEQGLQFDPEVVLGHTAATLERKGEDYELTTAQGGHFMTQTVLIAAGAGAFAPTKIGAVGEEEFHGRGLFYGVQDKSVFAGKRVAVVGGGDSAFDWAWELHGLASEVHLIHRRDQFNAHEETVLKVQETDVQFHLFRQVIEVFGGDQVQGVHLKNTQGGENETLDLDAVIVNVGFKSSLGPLKEWGLTIEKNQIVVDHLLETCLPNVFSVGDVCTYEGKLKLIATGVGEAATAVCVAKTRIHPEAKLFPGHSSDRELGVARSVN